MGDTHVTEAGAMPLAANILMLKSFRFLVVKIVAGMRNVFGPDHHKEAQSGVSDTTAPKTAGLGQEYR